MAVPIYCISRLPLCTVIDFVTVVPALLVIIVFSGAGSFSFLRVLRLLRSLRILRVLKIFKILGTGTAQASELRVQAMKVHCLSLNFEHIEHQGSEGKPCLSEMTRRSASPLSA